MPTFRIHDNIIKTKEKIMRCEIKKQGSKEKVF